MQLSQAKNNAFTMIELLVVAAIIGVLTALLLPLLQVARNKARTAACATNEKQWGMVFEMYSADNNGVLFCQDSGATPSLWDNPTINNGKDCNPYVPYFGGDMNSAGDKMRRMSACPAITPTTNSIASLQSYSLAVPYTYQAAVGWGPVKATPAGIYISLRSVPKPSEYLILIDTQNGGTISAGTLVFNTKNIRGRHQDTFNALFGDFHVENVTFWKLQQVDAQTSIPSKIPSWFQGN